ncbi:MAG TPA: choice-of-anchor tandem repeat GloVer-containing protein [Myxococcaceae bacterium]|nr:choice-of-anchor tandem repeat GloVer-containing protein [Myxococcaceae bacterium]
MTSGLVPTAGVEEGADGALYGTTSGGGTFAGTVYKINKDGTEFAIVHNFLGSPSDGSVPASAVLFGSDGALYGVASAGGGSGNGVVYRLTLN